MIIFFDLVITPFKFNPEENQQYRKIFVAELFIVLKMHKNYSERENIFTIFLIYTIRCYITIKAIVMVWESRG